MIPYAGLSFASYERIKRFILKNRIKNLSINKKATSTHAYYELTVIGKLICGATTGIIAQTITYPVDVVRRHMQLSMMFKDSAIRE